MMPSGNNGDTVRELVRQRKQSAAVARVVNLKMSGGWRFQAGTAARPREMDAAVWVAGGPLAARAVGLIWIPLFKRG